MPEINEVKTRLTLEDVTSDQLKKIEKALGDTDAAQQKAQMGLVEFARGFRDVFEAGRYAVDMIKGFGHALLDEAISGQAADTALAGLAASVQNIPWQDTLEGAQALGDELDDLSIKAGVAGSDVEAAFHQLVETFGATESGIKRAKFEVEDMAAIGGVLGKSVEGIAREIGFMSEGMLRTRGSMFQLLQSTGVFNADTKKAAEEWAKLSEGQRSSALEEGLERISHRLEGMPHSMKQSINSFESLIAVAKEKIGEPLITALAPLIESFTSFIQDVMPIMVKIAHGFAAVMRPLFFMIQGVMAYWVANKVFTIGKEAVAGAQAFFAAGAKGAVGNAATGAAGGGGMGAAAGIASAGVGVAADLLTFSIGELSSKMSDAEGDTANYRAMMVRIKDTAREGSKKFDEFAEKQRVMIDLMEQEGELREKDADDLRKTIALMKEKIALHQKEKEEAVAEAAAKDAQTLDEARGKVLEAMNTLSLAIERKSLDQAMIAEKAAQQWSESWRTASQMHDEATLKTLASIMASSEVLQKAFMELGSKVGDVAIPDLVRRLEEAGVQLGEGVYGAKKGGKGPLAGLGRLVGNTLPSASVFGGPTTVNVKQEFRDQDPDRVALLFKRDLMRAAERRYSATTSSPFGT